MKARILKGGWFWLGVRREAGDVIDAPSPEWIAHRVRDGLVEPIAEPTPVPVPPSTAGPVETAALAPAETTTLPSQRASAKQRKS